MTDTTPREIPFLWRLSSQDEQGFCAVSMIIPADPEDSENLLAAHTIQTRVMSFADDLMSESDEDEVLEWNEEDLNLFLRLVSTRVDGEFNANGDAVKVDLSDPRVIEIIQIVAAAGFGLVTPGEDLLVSSHADLSASHIDIGMQASIHTQTGYTPCIVVDMNEDDVVCVVLEAIESQMPGFMFEVKPYDLLLLKQHQILQPQYASDAPERSEILH